MSIATLKSMYTIAIACTFRDGTIDVGELSGVLSALGRVAPNDKVAQRPT